MTTTSRQKRMAKKRNARIQALLKRICNRVDKATFVCVSIMPVPDMLIVTQKYRCTATDSEKGYTASARQKMASGSKEPRDTH
ncbi:hypothetical protein ABQG65_08730 [Yersinia alsatica]|uniref:hypothetical protein n=1 Tax=Yersinia alsatica TaxID=2890317 RepID=UPI0032ED4E5C